MTLGPASDSPPSFIFDMRIFKYSFKNIIIIFEKKHCRYSEILFLIILTLIYLIAILYFVCFLTLNLNAVTFHITKQVPPTFLKIGFHKI